MAVVTVPRTRKGQTYRVRWKDENGRFGSKTFDRKKDADAYDTEIKRAKRAGTLDHLDRGKTTLHDFSRRWWTDYAETHLSPGVRKDYKRYLDNHVVPKLGKTPLNRLDTGRIQKFQAELVADRVGHESIRTTVFMVQGILQRVVEWGYLQVNPARAVRKLPKGRRHTVRPLAPATVEKMRAALLADDRPRDAALVCTLAYAGLRPGEAAALRWVDIGTQTITVDKAYSDEEKGTKTGKIRQVRLLAPLREDLDSWREISPDTDEAQLVFPRRDGEAMAREDRKNWATRVYQPMATEIGEGEHRVYDLRHSFASLLFQEQKTNHADIAQQMGHNIQTLYSTYTHTIEELRGKRPAFSEKLIRTAREKQARLVVAPKLPRSTR